MSLQRWRTFADVVAFALGTNVWVSMVILPALFVGVVRGPSRIIAALIPLPVLLVGLRRRSDAILLGMFPAAVIAPIALEPQLASTTVNSPLRVAVVAVGLIAYLFGVSFYSTFRESPTPRSVRLLSSSRTAPTPQDRRRERVYWELTVLSVAMPTLLIAWVNHDESVTEFVAAIYPGRVGAMTIALSAGALVLWLGMYHYAFLGILRPHRVGDRDLTDALRRTRAEVDAGPLRTRFYAAVAFALLAMLALVALRLRG